MRTIFVMGGLGQAIPNLPCAAYEALLSAAQADVDDAGNQLANYAAQVKAATAAGDTDTVNGLAPQLNSVEQAWNTAKANYQQALLNLQQCQRQQAGMAGIRLAPGLGRRALL